MASLLLFLFLRQFIIEDSSSHTEIGATAIATAISNTMCTATAAALGSNNTNNNGGGNNNNNNDNNSEVNNNNC